MIILSKEQILLLHHNVIERYGELIVSGMGHFLILP